MATLREPISVYNNWSSYDELSDNIPLTEALAMRELDEIIGLRRCYMISGIPEAGCYLAVVVPCSVSQIWTDDAASDDRTGVQFYSGNFLDGTVR